MAKPPPPRNAHAEPSKAFFIDMLTKDIGITDCILDLVDNAIDKAVKRADTDVMSILESGKPEKTITGARIEISYSPDVFSISDTCGGISIKDAENHVFLFGDPDVDEGEPGLSVFGIGLKRACFKLGQKATVSSQTSSEAFEVLLDVPVWKDLAAWEFPFVRAGPLTKEQRSRTPGTTVQVESLHEPVQQRFRQQSFGIELRARLASAYALFLLTGIELVVNGVKVSGTLPRLASDPITPAKKDVQFGDVDIRIRIGVAPPNERSPHGVYVFCNGRMVIEGDRSAVTGWGDFFPAFHSKFNSFVALIYFRSDDVFALPWRTTKQGVEREAPVYQAALVELRVYGLPVISFLSKLYPGDVTADTVLQREVISQAGSVSVTEVRGADRAFQVAVPPPRGPKMVSIQYSRPEALVDRLRAHLKNKKMAAYKVGEFTFDYYVEQELE